MREWRGVRRYLRLSVRRDAALEVSDELRFHLERKQQDLVASGLSETEARAEALRQFGDVTHYATDCRAIDEAAIAEGGRAMLMDELRQDVRYTVRTLLRAPGLALVVIATLGLGIGAVTSIFTVLSSLLLRPLPYESADRIVIVTETSRSNPSRQTTTSYLMYRTLSERAKSLEAVAVVDDWSPSFTGTGEPARLRGAMVTHEIFDVLRIRPAMGRPMQPSDNEPNAERIAIVSDGFWRNRLGSDPGVIGRSITISGAPRTIVGVLPRDFRGLGDLDAEIIGNNWQDTDDSFGSRYLVVWARVKPAVTVQQAQQELAAIGRALETEQPKTNRDLITLATPLRSALLGETRRSILLIFGAAILLLAIACANLASVLIGRGHARGQELALRAALGSSRSRVLRQLLTEAACLAALGTVSGFAVAAVGMNRLLALAPSSIPTGDIRIDWRVGVLSCAIVVLATIAVGLLPAVRGARTDLQQMLKHGGRVTSGSSARVRRVLVAGQLAVALSLTCGAGLLLASFAHVLAVAPGIRPERVMVMALNLPAARYPDDKVSLFYQTLVEEVKRTRGIESAAVTSSVPFSGGWDRVAVDVEGRVFASNADEPEGDRYIISPEYFQTLGIELKRGRLLESGDRQDRPPVAVVDEQFAKQLSPDGNAIGMRFRVPNNDSMATVVGIVNHVKHYGLDATSKGQFYVSHLQYPWRWMVLSVRTTGDPLALTPAIRDVIRAQDPDQPIYDIASLEQHMDRRVALRRFILVLVGVFAAAAVVLALVGVYGTVAFSVNQRRRELSIRGALGASPAALVSLVMGEAARLGLVGTMLGLLATIAGTRLLAQLLFGVKPLDGAVLGGATLGLLALTMIACAFPAWRASTTPPAETMRSD